eukprot:TRINITY_DN2972_c0_g1_i1.p1 TRINITY_DN2972_c0_g1~~TRINITY_DN2972_c0_g1_i1.p1  ORF type:complete len:479 (+),score=88.59 TRINITY_DN2972_c0_g1_i1:42-1478(+)
MDEKVLHPTRMNATIRDKVHYAVRGEIVTRANAYQDQLAKGDKLAFPEIISCNIGNPQSLKQKPLTFIRQVLALMQYPDLLKDPPAIFKKDAIARAKKYLDAFPGLGAYSNSKGQAVIRKEIADFIAQRDGYPSDPENIFLTSGASEAVKNSLSIMIRDENDGIMIPIPQYPLYSASIPLFGGCPLHYYLDEAAGWGLSVTELDRVVTEARKNGKNPRALVIINPGNPTGQCLSRDNMAEIIKFCAKERIVLLADEVYQENCYVTEKPFVSFKKVLRDLGDDYSNFELISYHSVSKGFTGECGQRGGYMELVGIHPGVVDHIYKLASISLCSSITGQVVVGCMVNPPKKGEESYETYIKESTAIYDSLKRRALKLAGVLSGLSGVSCNSPEGAMYLFPQVTMPEKALAAAKEKGIKPDELYAFELLDATGIVVVPGSGFGQREGTHHFRTTFLPPEKTIDRVVEAYKSFHANFLEKYA